MLSHDATELSPDFKTISKDGKLCISCRAALANEFATSNIWLLSTWNVTSVKYTQDFKDLVPKKEYLNNNFRLIICWRNIFDILS